MLHEIVLQEILADKQKLLSHYVFGNLQIFSINAREFGSEEKVLPGRDVERNGMRICAKWNLNVGTYYWKIIVRDCFIGDVKIADVDLDRNLLIRLEIISIRFRRSKSKLSGRKWQSVLEILILREWFLSDFMRTYHFQFKLDFHLYCNSLCPELENLYTHVRMNKTSTYQKGKSASSKTCQDNNHLTEALIKGRKIMTHLIVQRIARSRVHKSMIITA